MKEPYIICAAVHYNDGNNYPHQPINIGSGIVIAGRRHHNCFLILGSLLKENYNKKLLTEDSQGFLTSDNWFLNRRAAYGIAREADQLRIEREDKMLFSEDLY